MIEELDRDNGQLLLLRCIANDCAQVSFTLFEMRCSTPRVRKHTIGIDKSLELLGSQSRLELQRSAQERLSDGEGSSISCCHWK